MSDQSLLNPGTSLHIEGADNQLQEEVEFQQEEQEKEKELRELLTNAFDDFIEDDIISEGDPDLSSSRLSQKSANTSQHESTPLQAPMPYMATTNFTDSGHATSTPMGQNTLGYPPFIDDSPQGGTAQRWTPIPQSHMTPTNDVYDPAFNNGTNEGRHWDQGPGTREQGPNIHHYGNNNLPEGNREETEGGNDGIHNPNSPWFQVPRGYYLENYDPLQQQHNQVPLPQNPQITNFADGNDVHFNGVQQQYVPQNSHENPHEFLASYNGHEQQTYETNGFNQAYDEHTIPQYLQNNNHGSENIPIQGLSKSQENVGYGVQGSRENLDPASYSPQLSHGTHQEQHYMPQTSYETPPNYHQDTEPPSEQTNIYSRTLTLARQDHTASYEDGYTVKYANEAKNTATTNRMGPFDQTPTAIAEVDHDSITDSRQLTQLQVLYKARGRKLEDLTTEYENYRSETSREVRILKHQLSMAQGDREGMENSLKQCQTLLQSAKGEITQLNSKLESTDIQLKAVRTNKEELIGQLNSAEVNIETLNEHLTQITQSDSLERARIHHQSVVGGMQQKYDKEILGLKQKIDFLQENFTDKEDEVTSLKRSLAEVQRQAEMAQISRAETINRLNKSLEESQRQCHSLLESSVAEELGVVKAQLRQSTAAKTMTDEMCTALQGELVDLREQLSMFETASSLGAFSVHSSKTKELHDDSMADLGIKKTLDFKTPDLTARSQSPDISDDYVSKLKMELERCLMSNRTKRAAVNKLQNELRDVKSELNDFTSRCERAEKTVDELKRKLKDYEDEFSPTEGEKISPVEKRLRKDVDNLKAEKDILIADIQELKHRLEEVATSEEKVNEINVELNAEISQMVKDYDDDKRDGMDKCHTAYMQMVEDAKERVREEISSANQKERSELVEKYQSELFIVKEELRGAWKEVDNAKELYIKLSEEKTLMEQTLRSDFEVELQAELEKVKTQIIEEKAKEFEKMKKVLEDERGEVVEKAKEVWLMNQEREIMEKIEEAVSKAKDDSLKENTNSATKETEDEWKEKYKLESEKEIAQAREEILSEKEKSIEEEVLSRLEKEVKKWQETNRKDRQDESETTLLEEINQLKNERSKIVENLNSQITKLKDELNGLESDCKSLEKDKNSLEESLKTKTAEMQEEMGSLMLEKATLKENSISELEKLQLDNAQLIVDNIKLEEKSKSDEEKFLVEKAAMLERNNKLEETLKMELEKLTHDNAQLVKERDSVASAAKIELEENVKVVVKEAEDRFRSELEKTMSIRLQSDKSINERIEKEVSYAVEEARGLWLKEVDVNRATLVFEAEEAIREQLVARHQEVVNVFKEETARLRSDLDKAKSDLAAQEEGFIKEKEFICNEKDSERKRCCEEIQSQCDDHIKTLMHDSNNTLTSALKNARERQDLDRKRYDDEVKQLRTREEQLLGSLRSTPNTSDTSDNGRVTLAGAITCHLSSSNCDNCEILGTELKSLKEVDNIENLKEEKDQLKQKIAKYNSQVKKLIQDRQKLQMSFENMQQRQKLEEQHDKLKEQQSSGSDESNVSIQSDSRSFVEDQLRSDLKRVKLLLKEREEKWKIQIAEVKSTLEAEHSVVMETMKKKMAELRKSHSAELEKLRRNFTLKKEEMSLTIENLKSASRRLTSTPVQRPKRSALLSPTASCIQWVNAGLDQDGFRLKYINDYKGYGVFATKKFTKNDFLVEYCGEVISKREAIDREKQPSNKQRCFMFFFKHNGKECCIDATKTRGRFGHMVNDSPITSPECNSKMKLILHKGLPRLCLFAVKDIEIEAEISYDYGDCKSLWWRKVNQSSESENETSDDDPFDLRTDEDINTEKELKNTEKVQTLSPLEQKDMETHSRTSELFSENQSPSEPDNDASDDDLFIRRKHESDGVKEIEKRNMEKELKKTGGIQTPSLFEQKEVNTHSRSSEPVSETDTCETEKSALLEVRAHYLDAVNKIREDVLQHVTDTNLRAAEKIKTEIARSRNSLLLEIKTSCSRVVRNVLERSQLGVDAASIIQTIETHLETMSVTTLNKRGITKKGKSKTNDVNLSDEQSVQNNNVHRNKTNVVAVSGHINTRLNNNGGNVDPYHNDISVWDREYGNQNHSNSKLTIENRQGKRPQYSKLTCLEDSYCGNSDPINLPKENTGDFVNCSNSENSHFVSRYSVNSLDLSVSGYVPLKLDQMNSVLPNLTETRAKTDYRSLQNDNSSNGKSGEIVDHSSRKSKDTVQNSTRNNNENFQNSLQNNSRIPNSLLSDVSHSNRGSRKDLEIRHQKSSRNRSNSPAVTPRQYDPNPFPIEMEGAQQDFGSREKSVNQRALRSLENTEARELTQYPSLPSDDTVYEATKGTSGLGNAFDETNYNSMPVSSREWTAAKTGYKSVGRSGTIEDSGVGTIERDPRERSVNQVSLGRAKTWSAGGLETVFQKDTFTNDIRDSRRMNSADQTNVRFHRTPFMRQSSENGLAYSVLTQYEDNTRHSIGSVENLVPLEFDTETTLNSLGLGQRSPRKFNPVPEKPDSDQKKKVTSRGENSQHNQNVESIFQTPYRKSKNFQPPRTSTEKKVQITLPKTTNESPVSEISNQGRESVMSDISYNLHMSPSIDASLHEVPMYNQLGQSFIPGVDPPKVTNSRDEVQARGKVRRPVAVLGTQSDNQSSKK